MSTYHEQATLLRLMAHPVRLQILDVLCGGDECVCHLSAALGKPQPYISQQLAILRNGGVIRDVREGTNIFYHLSDAHVTRVIEAAFGPAPATGPRNSSPKRRVIGGCHCPKCAEPAPAQG